MSKYDINRLSISLAGVGSPRALVMATVALGVVVPTPAIAGGTQTRQVTTLITRASDGLVYFYMSGTAISHRLSKLRHLALLDGRGRKRRMPERQRDMKQAIHRVRQHSTSRCSRMFKRRGPRLCAGGPNRTVSMRSSLACLVLPLALSACAGMSQERKQPTAWAQTVEEVGKFPVGRVIAVERVSYVPHGYGGSPLYGAMAATVGPPQAVMAIPIIDAFASNWFFRHTVQLRATGEKVVWDEFAAYDVGACVAIRTEPDLLVLAVPGQCDQESSIGHAEGQAR